MKIIQSTYQNNFNCTFKILLNLFFFSSSAQAPILHTMIQRHPEYTKKNPLRICVGTWNVNGGKHFRSIAFKHQSMTDWLLDAPKISKENDTGRTDDNFELFL